MPYRPASRQRAAVPLRREDWDLLVKLPGRLVVAATYVETRPPRRTVAEGLAGIDAIAAGRSSVSRLVRDVVAAIYDERDDDPYQVPEMPDPETVVAEVLITCRSAAGLLAEHVSREDADAYRHWLESIAARVCQAGRAGLFSSAGVTGSATERRFLGCLTAALGGTG